MSVQSAHSLGNGRDISRETAQQWHTKLVNGGVVGVRRYRMKDYPHSFFGSDFVTW